jgi:uncharacterized protein YndB with AHSA1/START domain
VSDDFSALAYSVERAYPVDVDRMWRAWTDASELESWYAPTDLGVVPGSVVSDAVIGGRWAVAVDATAYGPDRGGRSAPPGHIAYFWGRYDDVSPGSRLIHTLSYSQDEADFVAHDDDAPSHDIVIDMEARDGGTWVRFAQYGDMPADQAAMAQAGMESYFDSLGNHLGV